MLYILLVGLLICSFLKVWCKRYKIEKSLKGFTTPPGFPLFKHFYLFRSKSKLEANLLDIVKKHGGLLKVELFYGLPFILVTDKDFINHILAVNPILKKDAFYDFVKKYQRDGLVICEPAKWKKSRKMLNPAFNVQLLVEYIKAFASPCDELIKHLKEEVGNGGFDAFAYTYLCGLDIICEAVMGVKLNAQAKENSQYVKDAHDMTRMIVNRLFSPLKRFYPTYILTKQYWEERQVAARISRFTEKVIEDRRNLRKTSSSASNNGINENNVKMSSLIDILLDAERDGSPLTNEEIKYETQTFLFAGHETAATVIALCLYCLSKYSEAQDKVFEELESIFSSDKRYPTWSDLGEMRYLEMFIKETMRLYSPVPFISRLIDQDVHYGDIFVPKGIPVIIYMQGVHMNPEYYPEPERFDPSRFETETKSFTFIPFGAGPRSCIGQRFAMLEIKYVICQVLRNFIILPVPGHVPERVIEIMLRVKNGAMIRLKSREV